MIKYVLMIEPITGWFKVMQYNDKKTMMIAKLVETSWLSRYPWPCEITFDHGSGLLFH